MFFVVVKTKSYKIMMHFSWAKTPFSEESCLHYLLPDKRDSSVTDRLRHAKTFESIPAGTNKFIYQFFPALLFATLWLDLASHFIDLTNKYCAFYVFIVDL